MFSEGKEEKALLLSKKSHLWVLSVLAAKNLVAIKTARFFKSTCKNIH